MRPSSVSGGPASPRPTPRGCRREGHRRPHRRHGAGHARARRSSPKAAERPRSQGATDSRRRRRPDLRPAGDWSLRKVSPLTLPLVSITLFLPLLGAALLVLMRGRPGARRPRCGLATSGLTLLVSVWVWARGAGGGGFSPGGGVGLDPLHRRRLPGRRGRHKPPAGPADDDPVLRLAGVLASHLRAAALLRGALPPPGDGLHRGVRRPRHDPLLRLLRGHARGHVLRHRWLGLRGQAARCADLLPVHATREFAPAARHPRAVSGQRAGHLRHAGDHRLAAA